MSETVATAPPITAPYFPGFRLYDVQFFAESQKAYDALDWPERAFEIDPKEGEETGRIHRSKRYLLGTGASVVAYPPVWS